MIECFVKLKKKPILKKTVTKELDNVVERGGGICVGYRYGRETVGAFVK